jgi:hypothetical protein
LPFNNTDIPFDPQRVPTDHPPATDTLRFGEEHQRGRKSLIGIEMNLLPLEQLEFSIDKSIVHRLR